MAPRAALGSIDDRRGRLLLLAALLGCGPRVAAGDGGSAASTSTSAGPTSPTGTTTGPADSSGAIEPLADLGPPRHDIPETCSTFAQDCPPGCKCTPYGNDGGSWNDFRCVPVVDDPAAAGEPCTMEDVYSGIDDCDGTSMCWDVDPKTNQGYCIPFCLGSQDEPSCADPCDPCYISQEAVIAICLVGCDPLIQNCEQGKGCYRDDRGFTCRPTVVDEGAGLASPCQYLNGCPAGLMCVSPDGVPGCESSDGCCAPYCPLGGSDICPGLLPGTTCHRIFDPDLIPERCGAANAGVCVLPG